MACSKYTLTNTGSTSVNFNYRRCDDSMWEYQVNLDPNQTKNIWLIDGTYDTAQSYESSIVLTNDGVYPLTPTPTPSVTVTPSVTTTITPTPTSTSNNTPTPTPTPTVTPSRVIYTYSNLGTGFNSTTSCAAAKTLTLYGTNAPTFGSLSLGDVLYLDSQCTSPIASYFVSDGTYYVDLGGSGEVTTPPTAC